MNKPIIDPSKLSEEQRASLRKSYWVAKTYLGLYNESLRYVGIGRTTLLEALFGSEFFNDTKQE